MNTIDRLRRSAASQQQVASVVEGKWRTIRVCLDEDSGEFFNMGIVFSYANKVEVRMLDSFERVKCLFGSRVDHNDLTRLLHDIEEVVREDYSNLETTISDTIRLSLPLYASGESAESIIDEFYNDIITLGGPSEKASPNTFRYRHPSRIKETVFQIMEEKMFLRAASLIQQAPYEVAMPSGRSIEVNLPLMSTKAAGAITSAWYKSPIVAENNILQASSDLLLLANNTDISKISLSVLVPGRDSGLTLKEFNRLSDATNKQLERLDKAGVAILDATSVDVLANKTIDWWVDAA